jgi:hypothetical protein
MSDVYHVGYLARDRERPHSRREPCVCERCAHAAAIGAAADAAWQAYRRGEVVLVQRRLGEMRFEYIAKPVRWAAA